MSSTAGPIFALWASAPREWNAPGLLGAQQVALRSTELGQAWVVEVFAKGFRHRLLHGTENQWVFIAQVLREDADSLFAFETAEERALFFELRELDAIGSKSAALAVGEIGTEVLARMARGEAVAGIKIAGLGPKTLEKLRSGLASRRDRLLPLFKESSTVKGDGSLGRAVEGGEMPSLLLQALLKVGIKSVDAVRLYRLLLEEDAAFDSKDAGTQIKALLARWGQSKARITGGSAELP